MSSMRTKPRRELETFLADFSLHDANGKVGGVYVSFSRERSPACRSGLWHRHRQDAMHAQLHACDGGGRPSPLFPTIMHVCLTHMSHT